MNIIRYCGIGLWLGICQIGLAQTIAIPGKPTETKLPHTLLKAAITQAGMSYNFPYKDISNSGDLSFTRLSQDLNNGHVDVMWNMTSKEMEQQFTAIYIPIYRGLLGMRIPLVKKQNQDMFAGITQLAELARFKAGSGKFWPDTPILEFNGLTVVKTLKYQNLFPMLEGERFDYFPRGLHEPWQEIRNFPELNLAVENNLLLRYTAPNYFFVANNNKTLANKLTGAFNQMIASGQFSKMFFDDAEVQSALQQANVKKRTMFDIKNPNLSDKTPLHRAELWFDPREEK
ncbi:hypothetical protein QX776_16270 [Alteromonadaceae bacterium BrNp21-10]|nr:hypothetical protein [Alteromonadaceae bacterium BrNp21-10]